MSSLPTRQTLLARIQDQYDEESWEEFVAIYRGYIYAVVRNIGLDHFDCEDLAQSVILKIWEKLPGFHYDDTRGKFRSWIVRITRNQIGDFLRKSTRLKKALDEGQALRLEKFFAHSTDPEVELIFRKEWEKFICDMAWNNISKQFSEGVQQSFKLSMQGQSDSVIAELLDIAESSVRVYRKRVQDKLFREVSRLERELN